MLVDHPPTESGAEIDGLAALDQRLRERVCLAGRQAAEVDGHAERRELIVRNRAARVAEHELRDLPARELLPVPLALDQLRREDHSTIGRPGVPFAARSPPSQALTVAPTSANSPSTCRRPSAFLPCT